MTWQPIETAPRDETWILVYADRDDEPAIHAAFWSPDGDWFSGEADSHPTYPTPTHWMPMPDLPEKYE